MAARAITQNDGSFGFIRRRHRAAAFGNKSMMPGYLRVVDLVLNSCSSFGPMSPLLVLPVRAEETELVERLCPYGRRPSAGGQQRSDACLDLCFHNANLWNLTATMLSGASISARLGLVGVAFVSSVLQAKP